MSMGFDPAWLAVREPVDAASRSAELLAQVGAALPDRPRVWDLAAGTGSLTRWLAPRLPAQTSFLLIDHDATLLAQARCDGVPIDIRTADLGQLTPAEAAGADLIAASALLDLLDDDQLASLAELIMESGTPALFTLSVSGDVSFTPTDPLDDALRDAFNDHQRRGGRAGPDAPQRFAAHFPADRVRVAETPWRLTAGHPLLGPWLDGWLAAAIDERPELAALAAQWRRRRLADPSLAVEVGHRDLLIMPEPERRR
ncbi:class I SAM-dependent methyltransferase [Naumannella huperziae]